MWVQSLGQKDPLKEGMATTPAFLPGERVPWTGVPGGLQSMKSQRVGHNLVTQQQQQLSREEKQGWFCLEFYSPCVISFLVENAACHRGASDLTGGNQFSLAFFCKQERSLTS